MVKNLKKITKGAKALGIGAIGLGVGSQVVGGIGGDIASKGQAGMLGVAGAFKPVGSIIGMGLTIGVLKDAEQRITKAMRKRR